MQPVYLNYTTAITPQYVGEQGISRPAKDAGGTFSCIEPDYTTMIPSMQLRRMSRLLKMGIYTGMACLREGGIEKPGGIITGTGKGSMTDTEKFVKKLNLYRETALNPTPFIMSTYNAVNGAIALQTQATGYNQTFVHRGSSFELALYDAQLRLNEARSCEQYLVGCFDEMTEEYFTIKKKIGYWKQDRDNNIPLHRQCDSAGTIAGEGASFFLVGQKPSHNQSLAINRILTLYQTREKLPHTIDELLRRQGWHKDDIGLLVLGNNGDSRDEPYYREVIRHIGQDKPAILFKNLCGEYETASGFGLWLTIQISQGKSMPEQVWLNKQAIFRKGPILFYNHYRGLNHNIILLSA